MDAKGNLYGTTTFGGEAGCGTTEGCGTIFELSPSSGGKWKEKILYKFPSSGKRGYYPIGNLVFDSAGALYGATSFGGDFGGDCVQYGCGVVFQLKSGLKGKWTQKVLHAFNITDGDMPLAGLVSDVVGNLYGTTYRGGTSSNCGAVGCGTVFEISPGSKGNWTETVLYDFNDGQDGGIPAGALAFDSSGDLFGTTSGGGNSSSCGSYGCGVVFELSLGAGCTWTESVLYSFCSLPNCTDGERPRAGVVPDSNGNLYGVTWQGGNQNCYGNGCGVAYELQFGGGVWTENVLHTFCAGGQHCSDGATPLSSLTFDGAGDLYGTTQGGGLYKTGGTVFEVTP